MSTRPEAVFVLMLLQSMSWLIAAISAAPFVLGGEVYMGALAAVTALFALGAFLCAIGVLWRRHVARALTIAVEVLCLFGSAVLLLLPVGFNHGLVSILVNVFLPVAVIVLLRKDTNEAFV